MTRSFLLLLVLLAAPIAAQTVAPGERFENANRFHFVALGTVEAVADSLVADFGQQECLEVRRGLDAAGVVAIALRDPCPGQTNRGLVRLVDGGDGTVRGTAESVFSNASAGRSLAGLPSAALVRRAVPTTILPVPDTRGTPCRTVENWRAELAAPPPDTTVQVTEVQPVLIGGIEGFVRSIRYPDMARRDGVQGRTFVRFTVGETGRVTCADLLLSLRPDLDAEALRAVWATRFTPGMRTGRPAPFLLTLPITFRIR